jgi:hypothetical protein
MNTGIPALGTTWGLWSCSMRGRIVLDVVVKASRSQSQLPAAVANAFFDATGAGLPTAPFTPARVREALRAAGIT